MGAVLFAKPILETTQLNNHDRMAAVWGSVVGRGRRSFFSVGAVYVHYLERENDFSGVYIDNREEIGGCQRWGSGIGEM